VFLGYPLHAPGRKERLRKEHLRRIDVPSLFVEGTRDPFCDLELLRPLVAGLDRPGELLVIEGGGHSYERPRQNPEDLSRTHLEVAQGVEEFVRRVSGLAAAQGAE
jgi:predicted alpha/beta-hydrolase family hydrolase